MYNTNQNKHLYHVGGIDIKCDISVIDKCLDKNHLGKTIHIEDFNISFNKKEEALVFKKYTHNNKNDTKMVIHDGGVSISDSNLNEKTEHAVLLLQSTGSGLLLPRICDVVMRKKMKRAVPGTIIYNKTTDKFYGKTQKGWRALNDHKKDFCAPSVTEKDKILGNVKPRPGMIIYNTTYHCFQIYSNKRWIKIV
jgi:hypothetical protein